jgi:hypothetical protein
VPYSSSCGILPLGNVLVGDRFVRYTVILIASAYKNLSKPGAEINIVQARDTIILLTRSITPF